MKSDKNIVSLILNENLILRAERKLIGINKINGFGNGSLYQETIHPASALLVKKEGENFTAINHEDQRLSNYLEKYNELTSIEVLIIENNDIEKVTFIAKELIPQLTSSRKFDIFFKSIINNNQYQNWVTDFLSIRINKKGVSLKFNTKLFSECFGANGPSLSTLNKIKSNHKENNIQISNTHLQIKRSALHNNIKYDHLRKIWNKSIRSKYSYDNAVIMVSNKKGENFIKRFIRGLEDYKSESNDSKAFAKNLEIFLDKESSNEQ